jgi:5'-nucleotidase
MPSAGAGGACYSSNQLTRRIVMKNLFTLVATLAFAAITVVGCAKKNTPAASGHSSAVTDISAAPVAPSEGPVTFAAPTDAPAAQPAVVEPAVSQTPAASAAPASGGGTTYTVKKGDTLFSIAKANYGSGKEWQKIVSANPGLSPSTLKAGKTITLP